MKYLIIALTFISTLPVTSQDFNEQIVVPLSSPSSRGTLQVGLVRGNIVIEGYSGKDVIITASSKESDCDGCHDHQKAAPDGMKRISSSAIELSASENGNRVKIETNSWKRPINLTVQVPKNFDLKISTVHGDIQVSEINGAMEVSATNGPMKFENISGSLICNTVNGTIEANFLKVTPNEPMSFVTLNGNVDITFPASVKATAKMKSDQGEIFTDFDMAVSQPKPEKSSSGNYKVTINSWVYGSINGGGAEFTFKNMNGDIYIRSK